MKLTKESSDFVDFIRGISSQLVLIGHLISFYNIKIGQFEIQNFGVVCFFLISGFLITMSIDNKDSSYSYKEFLIDRFSRIFIAYLPALVIITILDFVTLYLLHHDEYSKTLNFTTFISNIIMLQDFPLIEFIFKRLGKFNLITSFGSARQLWTVAIEWWIYIFFGYIMLQKFTIKTIGILIFSFLVILANVAGRGNGLTIIWALGSGSYFFLNKNVFTPKNSNYIIYILLVFLLIFFRLKVYEYNVYDVGFYTLLAITFIIILTKLQKNINIRYKKSGYILKFLADYSFSLYLLHYSIIIFFISLKLKYSIIVQIIFLFIFINIISFFFSKLTESYHLILRKRIKQLLH
jgi:peptidoglycan/LPS O-acetylase OafA/YrhL